MAGSTISTTITNSVTLGSGHYKSPLTITNTGEINVIGVGVDIPAAKTTGIVVNEGSIISQAVGVSQAAGSFYNAGLIDGSIDGFLLSGGLLNNSGSIESAAIGLNATGGSLNNAGRIDGSTFGLYASGGSITNLAAGIISGGTFGVSLTGSAQLTNDGDIAADHYGLKLSGTANVVNYGNISAVGKTGGKPAKGVYMLGGSLNNYGSIYGRSIGVLLAGGSFDNSGTVTGEEVVAVEVNAGTFTNTGILQTKTGHFALLMDGGVATNSGTISRKSGIEIEIGTVTNSGDVFGGVYLTGSSGVGRFINTGSVSGNLDFNPSRDKTAALQESNGSASVVNSQGGVIFGADYGVAVFGGYLDNAGVIGGGQTGLLADGGSGSNSATGTISGTYSGVNADRGSFTNLGSISGVTYGVHAYMTTSLVNYGNISGGIGALLEGSLTNAGEIVGETYGVEVTSVPKKGVGAVGRLHNSGSISGTTGVELISGRVGNYGMISGAQYGVAMKGGSLSNAGNIYGGKFGVEVLGGSLTNAGTIAGGTDAVYGVFVTLTVDPGAVFNGDVENAAGTSLLGLGGTDPASLSGIGSKIFGFTDISFASGSEWRISGNEAGLAAGQQINGFARQDKIVLDGFAAKSDSYVTGVGLVLANAGGKETLDITGSFSTGDFQVIGLAGNTTIALASKHGLDQAAVLDAGRGQVFPDMGFLRPAEGGGAALGDYAANRIADLFNEIQGAKDTAADYAPRIERVISQAPVEAATLAAHGLGPALLGLTGLSEQHNINSASILLFGFEKLA